MGCQLKYDNTPFSNAVSLMAKTINSRPELHFGLTEYIESCTIDELTDMHMDDNGENGIVMVVKPSADFNNLICLAIERNNEHEREC